MLSFKLQLYANQKFPDAQAGFRKGEGTGDQIANIHWIIEKAREFQKKHVSSTKAFDCMDHDKLQKALRVLGIARPSYLSPEKPICGSRSNS